MLIIGHECRVCRRGRSWLQQGIASSCLKVRKRFALIGFARCRSAAADVEKELASVKRQCHESFRQLRAAAASEAANLGAKLDAVDREVVGLLSINIALRRTMADAAESRREFESQIKQCMVGRDEW